MSAQQSNNAPTTIDEARYEIALQRLYLAALKKGIEAEALEAKAAEQEAASTNVSKAGSRESAA